MIQRVQKWEKIEVPHVGFLYGDNNGVTNILSERHAMSVTIETISTYNFIVLIWPDYYYTFKESIRKVPDVFAEINTGKFESVSKYIKSPTAIGKLISCLTVGGQIFCANPIYYKNKNTEVIVPSWSIHETKDGSVDVNLDGFFKWSSFTFEDFFNEWELVNASPLDS